MGNSGNSVYGFSNSIKGLRAFDDRICDSCLYADWYKGARDVPKYDVFLKSFWSWEKPRYYADCRSTETFYTLAECKNALNRCHHMTVSECQKLGCPHLSGNNCEA